MKPCDRKYVNCRFSYQLIHRFAFFCETGYTHSMNRLLLKIFASLLLAFSGIASVFASTLPFTDVSPTDDYYQDLLNLYERGIIADTVDNRFNPDSLMNRDDFVAIVVGVSCKNCLAPSFDDIIKYTESPFLDFSRENKNFYCVAYAKEQGIVE